MKNPTKMAESLTEAVRERDPERLLTLNRLSLQAKVDLREALKIGALARKDREQLIQWAWHDNSSIKQAARTLILLVDLDLAACCFEKFLATGHLSPPFELRYNSSEHEFHVDLPETPGRGVSHYGRDDKEIDRILLVLERAYQKMYPQQTTSGFRT